MAFSRIPLKPLAVAAVLALPLAACSSDPAMNADYQEQPVEELYNVAVDALEAQDYAGAAKAFDEVERQHPYSVWATKAQMMAAYSLYMSNAYDEAIGALDRFMQLHPTSEDMPYAFYLKGLCYYEQISDVGRDQLMTQLALESLQELIRRYPESEYSRDAQLKVELTHDHLAGKEMDVGRYYMTRSQYIAAINRFRTVVEQYQTTTHVPEALLRMVESYLALGLTEDARKTAAVLGHNFPSSQWYLDAYALVEDPTIRERRTGQDGQPWYKFW